MIESRKSQPVRPPPPEVMNRPIFLSFSFSFSFSFPFLLFNFCNLLSVTRSHFFLFFFCQKAAHKGDASGSHVSNDERLAIMLKVTAFSPFFSFLVSFSPCASLAHGHLEGMPLTQTVCNFVCLIPSPGPRRHTHRRRGRA